MNNLSIIIAVDNAGGYSKNGKIPWIDPTTGKNKYPEDFKRFKYITKNSTCIMGRNTYEEIIATFEKRNKKIKSNLLPNRSSIVLSRTGNFDLTGVTHAVNLRQAIDQAKTTNIFVIGGERVIREALPFTSKIYLTVIKENYSCDLFFPLAYLQKHFRIVSGEETETMYFVNYERIST